MSHRTRREALQGLAAAALIPGTLDWAGCYIPILFHECARDGAADPTKQVSAREVLAEHLKQIERVNPRVNAIVTLVPEMAADSAARADEMQAHEQPLGPLHGLPVVHKDLLETRGIRTTFGSQLYKELSFPPQTIWLSNG